MKIHIGKLIKSTTFHTTPNWVVKANEVLDHNVNNEFFIDPTSFNLHPLENATVKFSIVEVETSRGTEFFAYIHNR